MGITQIDMITGMTKEETAIALLQAYEPQQGYYLAFSGGKDSIVIYDLAVKSGVRFDAHYCVSPIDPTEIHQFIKEKYPEVQWDYYARGFFKKIIKKGLPSVKQRWCCKFIKEAGGIGRVKILGNRAAESTRRKRDKCFEAHRKKPNTFLIKPIILWSNGEVWEYIKEHDIPYCSLYDEGFKRLGCVLCPYVENIRMVKMQIERFPKIVRLWRLACDNIVKYRLEKGRDNFKTGQELWDWWTNR